MTGDAFNSEEDSGALLSGVDFIRSRGSDSEGSKFNQGEARCKLFRYFWSTHDNYYQLLGHRIHDPTLVSSVKHNVSGSGPFPV